MPHTALSDRRVDHLLRSASSLHWLPWPVVWRCELCCLLTSCVAV